MQVCHNSISSAGVVARPRKFLPTHRPAHHRQRLQRVHYQTDRPQQRQQLDNNNDSALTVEQMMADMTTMLGGISTERFSGYAGQWRTWEVVPAAQQQQQQQQKEEAHTNTTEPTPAIPTNSTSSLGQHTTRLIDDSINVRLWRIAEKQGDSNNNSSQAEAAASAAAAGGMSIQQANFYHHPGKMAGPSTRFAQYLTGNTMTGRPDGYGVRVWSFTPESEMLQPDASGWLTGSGTPAECSMRVLTVPDAATTIINGALPSGFEEGHNPRFWVLEFIAKDPGSAERRWASMAWYDLGELVVNRSINEDLLHLSGEPDDILINPEDIHFAERREGLLPLDIDTWANQHTHSKEGTATTFTFTSAAASTATATTSSSSVSPGSAASGASSTQAASLIIKRTDNLPCTWSSPLGSNAGRQAGSGADKEQHMEAADAEGGGSDGVGVGVDVDVDVMVQVYPDWSYTRVPRSLKACVESGADRAVFEAGTVLRDGTLVRWLLEYETGGRRLIQSATFETYPAASPTQPVLVY